MVSEMLVLVMDAITTSSFLNNQAFMDSLVPNEANCDEKQMFSVGPLPDSACPFR